MLLWGGKLRGRVRTTVRFFSKSYDTQYRVDPGLEDTITPISNAQISAMASRNTSYVSVHHSNNPTFSTLPSNLRYLNTGRRGLLPGAGYGYPLLE